MFHQVSHVQTAILAQDCSIFDTGAYTARDIAMLCAEIAVWPCETNYRKRRKFGEIKVWRISKEINFPEESLANFPRDQ